MAHETTSNPRNEHTLSAKKSVEKLPSSTDPADNNFVSSDVDNCINNTRRSEKKNAKKTSQQSQQITKRLLIVGDSIVKNIEPYKMKKSTKYVTTVKSIPGATTEGRVTMSKVVWLILRLMSCYYTAVQMISKKTLLLRKSHITY